MAKRILPHGNTSFSLPVESTSCFMQAFRAWKQLQVSYHGGKYSMHRALALAAYERNTSLSRALLVCLVTPVPVILLILLQESVPLQAPSAGWRVNYGFWARAWILAFVVGHMVVAHANYLVGGVKISERRLLLLSMCASLSFTACSVPVVKYVIFPVPFFVLLMAPPFYALLLLSFRVVVGKDTVQRMLEHREQFLRYLAFLGVTVTLAAVYPAYEALFRVAEGPKLQTLVILLLPIVKVTVKQLVMQCISHLEDMMPEAVIFTVDFFNSIYIATCMQTVTSVNTATFMIVCDLLQTVSMLYGLHHQTAGILARNYELFNPAQPSCSLLTALCVLFHDPDKLARQNPQGIRVYSSIPHQLSSAEEQLLGRLDTSLGDNLSLRGPRSQVLVVSPIKHSLARKANDIWLHGDSVHPFEPSAANPTKGLDTLNDALKVLFTTECLVLTAYLEAVVPFFYSCYVLLLVRLPSACYHTEMSGITRANIGSRVAPLLVFGLLQMMTFLLLTRMIRRNCGMRALHQLAFVLEAQTGLIQNKLMAWMVVTLCFRVVHFGVDFSFQFKSS